MHPDEYIVKDSHSAEKSYILKGSGKSQLRNFIWFPSRYILSQHLHSPLSGIIDTGDTVKQRRFACSIRSNDSNNLSLIDTHIHMFQSYQPSKALS